MNLLLLPKYYPEGSSSRYRFYNYISYLEQSGFEITIIPLLMEGYVKNLYSGKISIINRVFLLIKAILNRIIFLKKNRKKYDLVLIEKELFPYLPYWVEKLFLNRVKYGLDYDDATFIFYQSIPFLKQKCYKLSAGAQFVTAGNSWYKTQLYADKVHFLPTVIDLDKYPKNISKKENIFTIVWIGSPATELYLDILETPLKRLSQSFEFKLRIIGSKRKIIGVSCENMEWSEKTEVEFISKSHIGIMPLKDSIWEKGKCGFKLIQYMACGLPVIASPTPANTEIITNDVGFIANNDEDWLNYMSLFFKNPLLIEEIGKNSRVRIEKFYTYQIQHYKLIELIKDSNK